MRSFNFTDRKRIARQYYTLTVSSNDGSPSFDISMPSLSSLGFPDNAKVIIEAYHQAHIARYDFGTIGKQIKPDTALSMFPDLSLVMFRIKVTDPASGRILGWADKIRPEQIDNDQGNHVPLLPVRSLDLGGEIWRINFDEEPPVLELEKCLGDKYAFLADARNAGLILPEALRTILFRILVVEKINDPDGTDWQENWLKFARSLNDSPIPRYAHDSIEEIDEWIGDCVSRFARQHSIRERCTVFDNEG